MSISHYDYLASSPFNRACRVGVYEHNNKRVIVWYEGDWDLWYYVSATFYTDGNEEQTDIKDRLIYMVTTLADTESVIAEYLGADAKIHLTSPISCGEHCPDYVDCEWHN